MKEIFSSKLWKQEVIKKNNNKLDMVKINIFKIAMAGGGKGRGRKVKSQTKVYVGTGLQFIWQIQGEFP